MTRLRLNPWPLLIIAVAAAVWGLLGTAAYFAVETVRDLTPPV